MCPGDIDVTADAKFAYSRKQLKHGIGADLIFFMLYLCYRRTVS